MSPQFEEALAKLPQYLANHLMISVIALGVGVLISVPLAVAIAKVKPVRWPVLTGAGIIQTIPSLALLALMVPLLGLFGFWPAVVALTLYSILPILRNTTTAIINVDPAMTEAARGLGMTPMQMLLRVELPLAAPVILAGIRTATVWVVGIATLTTPVGQTSLGNYIFSGLQTRNWTAVLFGCVAAAVLAVVLDMLTALLESGAARRSRPRLMIGGAGLLVIVGGGLFAPMIATALRPEVTATGSVTQTSHTGQLDRPIRVGSKTFTEQYILASLVANKLEQAGLQVERAESLGSTVGFDALTNNDVDIWIDYTGTIWANYMNREASLPAWNVLDQVTGWVLNTYGVRNLGPLGFENAYALAMRRDQAEELGIETIADLVEHAPDLSIGGDYEFFERPEWFKVRDEYGLAFREIRSFDSTFMYEAVAQGEVDVISAFSSDGRIAAFDLVVLDDPQQSFPPYDAVLMLSPEAAKDPRVAEALQPMIRAIDVRLMRRANQAVDLEKKTPVQAAQWLNGQIEAGTDDPQ